MSEKGPKLKVPRLVWQAGFCLFILVALVPFLLTIDQIPYKWDRSLVEEFAPTVVALVYGSAMFAGASKFMTWLFGPLPDRGGDQSQVN